ncbi:hypothetical protein Gotur_030570 [Gossypium turneri]
MTRNEFTNSWVITSVFYPISNQARSIEGTQSPKSGDQLEVFGSSPNLKTLALGLIRKILPLNFPVSATEMAKEAQVLRPWFLDLVPVLVVLLIAAHVYWIFRLATDKQPQRRKAH